MHLLSRLSFLFHNNHIHVKHKDWISADTLRLVEERRKKKDSVNNSRTRASKAAAQAQYQQAHTAVKKSARQDKRNYFDALAEEAQAAAGSGNMKGLYDNTKKLAGKFHRSECPVKGKNGESIPEKEQQRKRWVEHFEELLNRPTPTDPPDIPERDTDLPISCDPPSREEIRKAIRHLKNNKAAGPDDCCAEAFKADIETSVELLYPLFKKIWEEEDVPLDWKEGYLVKLPKKGDLSNCQNYRGITLLSIPGKIFNRILLERLRDPTDPHLRDQQAGFRKNRSCADQIATLRIILEQSLEWNSSLYCCFVDYEKAFDSVHRESLWQLLRHYGIPTKLVNIIKNS